MSLDLFLQHFLNALTLGSLYGLIAIGYTMVYGILRLINFAHGDILMLGAYFVFYGISTFLLPWPLAVVVAILGASLMGVLVDRIAYKPLRDAPRISALISAIAVSFFLESLGVVVFSGLPRPMHQPEWLVSIITVGGTRFMPLTLIVPAVTALLVLLLLWVVYHTRPGLAMRAISRDIETTRMLGVSVDKIIALTFGIGSALAAASGIMWALRYPQINPYMGVVPGFKAFIAAVFGGIGSIQGAVVGGLILGFIEIMTVAFLPPLSGYRDAFAFILLVVILLVKPTGLFGEKQEDKI
ncbi:MAG: branched-chain amino acid ABC transporter permease [Desulfovibrionaceae bacterium]|nr:branched-chain amino acid ABC transporter permease [Desulfovibrionaceae bacterium]